MSTARQIFVMLFSITIAYVLLAVPVLAGLHLQAVAIAVVILLLTKRINGGKLWHVLPTRSLLEISVGVFIIAILVGSTGVLSSPFFPLVYVALFFLLLAINEASGLFTTLFLVLFLYGLQPTITLTTLYVFASLPITFLLFMLGKHQYDAVHITQKKLEFEEQELQTTLQKEQTEEIFIQEFLMPKLNILKKLLHDSDTSKQIIENQLSLLMVEIEKMLRKIQGDDSSK